MDAPLDLAPATAPVGALRAVLRRVRPLHVVFAALVAAHIVPLWVAEFLPFMDLPQHLATIAVLHGADDPELGYGAYFFVDLLATPYLFYYLVTDLLAYVLPLETANRVFLSLYVLLLPLSAWRYLRAFGRDPVVSLLAFPVVYGTFLFMGFVNYVSALPFLLLAMAALRRWLDGGGWRAFTWLSVHTLVLFLSHTQAYLLYVGCAGLYLLLAWPGLRTALRAALHLVPTLVLFAIWAVSARMLAGDAEWQAGNAGRNASPAGAQWEDLATTLRELPARLVDAYRDSSDELLLALLGFVVLLLLVARRPPVTEGARAWLRENALELVSLVLLALYVALPVSYKWIWPLNWRLVPVAYLVGLAWLRLPPLGPWTRAALVTALAVLSLAGVWNHAKHIRAFDEEVGPLTEVLDAAGPRRRVMGLIFDKGSGVVTTTLAPYLHFAQYYQARRGGMADFSFANFAQSPVKFHDRTGPPKLPVRWEWTPEQLRWPSFPPGAADYYDYYLVRGQPPGRIFGGALGREVREVIRRGRWTLYERVRATGG